MSTRPNMKIIFFESDNTTKKFMGENSQSNWDLTFLEAPLLEKTDIQPFLDAEILSSHTGSQFNEKTISPFKKLKAIITRTTGVDHIDLDYCKKRNIKVLSVPCYGTATVAEFTFTLILALLRRLETSEDMLAHADIVQPKLCGADLSGKTIGIVGLGKIGSHVAEIAHGFGMKILGYDPHAEKTKSYITHCDFDDLLKQSDLISLHCPGNCHTKDLINHQAFMKMKKEAILINTARGQVIDTQALYKAIKENRLGGVAMDVAEEERFLYTFPTLWEIENLSRERLETVFLNQKLLQHKKVLMTPHMAFNTQEANRRILETTLENIKSI
ncbi:MAG: hydroxyacid dehydrogenase [Alphaproteobacteria bacterium]|nr:hydroxyacid dehydrogenase [Alphaproteobacteria bacterium]